MQDRLIDWTDSGNLYRDFEDYRLKLVVFPDGGREATLTKQETTVWRDQYQRDIQSSIRKRKGHDAVPAWSAKTPEEKSAHYRETSSRRARAGVRMFVKTSGADHMVTLTYRENMQDKSRLKRDWKAFVRLFSARYPKWCPIAVPERQQRGAWHLHIAVKGFQQVNHLRSDWHAVVGKDNGSVNVAKQKRRWGSSSKTWDVNRLVGYLCGYISKSFDDQEKGERRYWPSREITVPLPVVTYLDAETWSHAIELAYSVVAEGCAIGVTQWLDKAGCHYWISNSGPPIPPF